MRIALLLFIYLTVSYGSIVTDIKTKLMWQDNLETSTLKLTYKEAKNHCKKLELIGYTDWRLPTQEQLLTITNKNRFNPSIKPEFKNISSSYYWSSSPNISFKNFAWYTSFKDGHSYSSIDRFL